MPIHDLYFHDDDQPTTTSPDHQPTAASVYPAAAAAAGVAPPAATTRPARLPVASPETPPAARRAQASERVAREVLNFMAAIERGESLAVGLPLPPGAVGLGGAAVGANGGGGGGRAAPALEQVVKDLPRIQVHMCMRRESAGAPYHSRPQHQNCAVTSKLGEPASRGRS